MSTEQQTTQELRRAIDTTRRDLGETVERLAAKTAIRARLRDAAGHITDDLKHALHRPPVRAAAVVGLGTLLLVGWNQLHRTE